MWGNAVALYRLEPQMECLDQVCAAAFRHSNFLHKPAIRLEVQRRKSEKFLGTPGKMDAAADNEVLGYLGEYPLWNGQYRRQKCVLKGCQRLCRENEKRKEAELSCAIFAHNIS